MRKELSRGTILKLVPLRDKTIARVITVERLLGQGAGSIAYLVEEDGITFVMKECFPFAAAERNSENSLIWRSSEIEEKAKARFETAFDVQIHLMMDLDSMNQTARLAGALFTANNTLYTLTDRRNATTYDRVKETSLADVFVTARAITGIVGAYHKAGYLHLDIKPENIMVYPETREMVQMIDFDSIIPMSDKDALTLSFSPRYAAPELVALDVANICEATDYYEIGATAFVKVFGRFPESRDRSIFSRWGFSAFFDGKSEKLKRMSTVFFNKTLAANPGDRFQSINDLIDCLDKLIEESKKRIHLISSLPESHNIFVGRERELEAIGRAFDNSKIVVLHGIGGIGKTELALRYSARSRDRFDVICFGRVTDYLESLFDSTAFLNIVGENRADRKGIERITDLVDDRTLLVIDNLDSIDDPMIDDLYRLDCRILITSRCDFTEIYPTIEQISVFELSEEEQYRLFLSAAGEAGAGCDIGTVRSVLSEIDGYTLLITLIAKLLNSSSYSLKGLCERIHSAGISAVPTTKVRQFKDIALKDSVINILRNIFDMSRFTAEEYYVLNSLLLFDGLYIEKSGLLDEIGMEYEDTLNDLAERGWLQIQGTGKNAVYSMHSIIAQVYAIDHHPALSEMQWVKRLCFDYAKECDKYCASVLDGTISKQAKEEWDNPYYRNRFDQKYISSPPTIWRAAGDMRVYFSYRSKGIATILGNCVYDNENDIACLLDILGRIVKSDLSRAINYTVNDYSIPSLISQVSSEKLLGECLYYNFLFQLRNISKDSFMGEVDIPAATGDLVESADRYGAIIQNCCHISTELRSAILRVLNPCFDLGVSWGLYSFERSHLDYEFDDVNWSDDYEETVEDALYLGAVNLFTDLVDRFMDLARESYSEEDDGETHLLEQRYALFKERTSIDYYWNYYGKPDDDEAPSSLAEESPEEARTKSIWYELSKECAEIVYKCRLIGFGQLTASNRVAKRILNKDNQKRAEQLLSRLPEKLTAVSAMLDEESCLPDYARQLYNGDYQAYLYGMFLFCLVKEKYNEAIDYFDVFIHKACEESKQFLRAETLRLTHFKPICNSECIKQVAQILYEIYLVSMQDGKGWYSEQDNIETGLTIAELMEDDELQNSFKRKRNKLMGTNF